MMIKLNDFIMNHVNAATSASTVDDTNSKKPGDVKMKRLVLGPGENYRARLQSNNVAYISTAEGATSTKFKIRLDAKMKGPLHMEVEEVEDDRFGIHSKRVADDVKNVASTSMVTSVEPKSEHYKFKKAKTHYRHQVNGSAGKHTAPIKPATMFSEVDTKKLRNACLRYVNAKGKPSCPVCKRTFRSFIPLSQHVEFHSDLTWHTGFDSRIPDLIINQSGENHNHEAALVDLTKCLYNWNIAKKKRSPSGSRPIEMDEDHVDKDVRTAADTLMLMVNGRVSKAKQPKTSMWTQMEREAADGLLMFLGDENPHLPMGESSVQVPTSTTEMQTNIHELGDTVNGSIKEVLDFDLNELPAMEEDE